MVFVQKNLLVSETVLICKKVLACCMQKCYWCKKVIVTCILVGAKDYSSHFGPLFVKDLQYVSIYYVQTYFSNILIEKVVVIDKSIKKSLISRKWFFHASTTLYFVLVHATVFSVINTQQHLTNITTCM